MKRIALLFTSSVIAAFAGSAAPAQHAGPGGPGFRPETRLINEDGGSSRPAPSPVPRPAPNAPPPRSTTTRPPVTGHTPPRQIITPRPTGPTSIPPMRTPTGPVVTVGVPSGHRGPTTVVSPPATPAPPAPRATTFVTDDRRPVSSPPRVADAMSRPVTVYFRDRARGILLTVVTTERGVPAAMARYHDWEFVAKTPAK